MTTEIGLLSITTHPDPNFVTIPKPPPPSKSKSKSNSLINPNSTTTIYISPPSSSLSSSTIFTWMWNHRKHQEVLEDDEDSWEVRAFAEDTRNIMATTWPPKSYSCSFCRREFRSAQALGGHMNVHRHDRARLQHHPHHQQPLPPTAIAVPASSPNPITTPSSSSHPTRLPNHHQELISVANGNDGLRLFYHIPNPNNNDNTHINYAPFSITHHHHEHNTANTPLMSGCNKLPCSTTTTSTLVSISSHPPNHNLVVRPTCSPSFNLAMGQGAYGTNGFSSTKAEESSSSSRGYCHNELDLELRLGRKSPHQNGNKKND